MRWGFAAQADCGASGLVACMRWWLFCSGVPAPDRIFIIETEVESGASGEMGAWSVEGINQNKLRVQRKYARPKTVRRGQQARARRRRGSNQPRERAASYEKGGL